MTDPSFYEHMDRTGQDLIFVHRSGFGLVGIRVSATAANQVIKSFGPRQFNAKFTGYGNNLLYHFHRTGKTSLKVKPFLDHQLRGVFSTRAPSRPNSIGISVVRLLGIEGRCLQVADLDIIDGTPLLDIKPFVPHFDGVQDIRTGWLESHSGRIPDAKDDGRFS